MIRHRPCIDIPPKPNLSLKKLCNYKLVIHEVNLLLTKKMQRNQTVLIAPSVVVTFLDDATVVGQGQLGLCVILPVAVAHHPVACPNPESEDTTLPQTDPEWTVCLGVIQPLYNSILIFDVLNPQQACVFGLAVVKGLFPSRFYFNDFDSHMT